MSDASRPGMHARLRTKLGPELGEDVIDVLAPLERGELARQDELVAFRGEIGERLGRMEGRIGELAGKIDGLEGRIDGLKGRIDAQTSRIILVLVPIMVSLVVLAKLV